MLLTARDPGGEWLPVGPIGHFYKDFHQSISFLRSSEMTSSQLSPLLIFFSSFVLLLLLLLQPPKKASADPRHIIAGNSHHSRASIEVHEPMAGKIVSLLARRGEQILIGRRRQMLLSAEGEEDVETDGDERLPSGGVKCLQLVGESNHVTKVCKTDATRSKAAERMLRVNLGCQRANFLSSCVLAAAAAAAAPVLPEALQNFPESSLPLTANGRGGGLGHSDVVLRTGGGEPLPDCGGLQGDGQVLGGRERTDCSRHDRPQFGTCIKMTLLLLIIIIIPPLTLLQHFVLLFALFLRIVREDATRGAKIFFCQFAEYSRDGFIL